MEGQDNIDQNPLIGYVDLAREYTYFGSILFFLLALVATIFHESNPFSIGGLIFIWVFVQISQKALPFVN